MSETDRLARRVDQILQIARDREPSRTESVQVDEVLEDLLDEWEPRLEDSGFTLDRDVAPVSLLGDSGLLRDAFSCLLDNALKYRRRDIEDVRLWIRLAREGGRLVLEVTDNGIGIPVAKRKVVFQRFARVEGPGRGLAGGHGLGLAFVRDAIHHHRGRVEVRDGIDGGTRFVVRIPISPWQVRLKQWLNKSPRPRM